MTIIRSIFKTFENLADHMVGQDVERHNTVDKNRLGGDFAAIAQARSTQGLTTLGLGR